MLNDVKLSGLQFVMGKDAQAKRPLLRRLFEEEPPPHIYVADASYQQIIEWYMNYAGWQVNPYHFIVSKKNLDDWVEPFLQLERKKLGRDCLPEVGSFMTNHWEHGIEYVSLDRKDDALESKAKEISRKLNLPLEVRDRGIV